MRFAPGFRRRDDVRGSLESARSPQPSPPTVKPLGEREHSAVTARYARGVAEGRWRDDPAQRTALAAFDRLHEALLAPPPGVFARLRAHFGGGPEAPRGLYLWGAVGRGKTMLMDQLAA